MGVGWWPNRDKNTSDLKMTARRSRGTVGSEESPLLGSCESSCRKGTRGKWGISCIVPMAAPRRGMSTQKCHCHLGTDPSPVPWPYLLQGEHLHGAQLAQALSDLLQGQPGEDQRCPCKTEAWVQPQNSLVRKGMVFWGEGQQSQRCLCCYMSGKTLFCLFSHTLLPYSSLWTSPMAAPFLRLFLQSKMDPKASGTPMQ